ncbi:tim44-like domain-containing protein [Hirsutella rhossiliensis]|uniref:Tim44-like domain-containing protein n=1 Tax=Hirsutella rhossiliensis TaxID=111463 RepID=A0A9P8MXX0_9HYPO|nr:tim44-like domain-containing protein [Hirsutella rhossiliensis]KAH0964358.1 tim44-like domain-containing protein [Hirsutella rhossiliensis]
MASAAMSPARRLLLLLPPRCPSSSPAICAAAAAARRHYAAPSRKQIAREVERTNRMITARNNRELSLSQMQKEAHADYFKDGDGPLFPTTFVAMPLSQCPRNPSRFFDYQWARMKQWLLETGSVLGYKLNSMASWTSRPKWKVRRGQIAPTAKAMYREMLEAFAHGDKQTLHNICLAGCAKKLISAIDRRDNREGWRFEVVKYNRPLLYPRLMSHRIHEFNPYDKTMATEQAVVAICSTQQASKYTIATGATIPGTLKLQDKTEYVVLSRQVNQKTFVSTPWRIWGTMSPTTLEGYLKEQAIIGKEQARRAGWGPETTKRM